MRRMRPDRRGPRQFRTAPRRPRPPAPAVRLSDLILGCLGVTLLGGLALVGALSLLARAVAP